MLHVRYVEGEGAEWFWCYVGVAVFASFIVYVLPRDGFMQIPPQEARMLV